jgi:hypothetical protein
MSERKADSKGGRKRWLPMQRPYTLSDEIFTTKLLLLTRFGIKIPTLAGYTLDELRDLVRQKKEEAAKQTARDNARKVADMSNSNFIDANDDEISNPR